MDTTARTTVVIGALAAALGSIAAIAGVALTYRSMQLLRKERAASHRQVLVARQLDACERLSRHLHAAYYLMLRVEYSIGQPEKLARVVRELDELEVAINRELPTFSFIFPARVNSALESLEAV